MRAFIQVVCVAALLQAGGVAAAFAGEVTVSSPDYAQLPADKQSELVAELKKQGLLAQDDTVVNTAPAETGERTLGPGILLALAPAACKLIAETKKADELGKCVALTTPEAQDGCKIKVDGKFSSIESICNLIKLF